MLYFSKGVASYKFCKIVVKRKIASVKGAARVVVILVYISKCFSQIFRVCRVLFIDLTKKHANKASKLRITSHNGNMDSKSCISLRNVSSERRKMGIFVTFSPKFKFWGGWEVKVALALEFFPQKLEIFMYKWSKKNASSHTLHT